MSGTDAWYGGYYQSERAEDLFDYQAAKGYGSQISDAASDMEPSWDGTSITKQLVNGDRAQGWALYYDYGSAGGCPQSGSSDGPDARSRGARSDLSRAFRVRNGWLVSDGRTLVAVYAGAAGEDPSVGRVVIVRQDLGAGEQTVRTIDAGTTGALTITAAPLGSSASSSAQTGAIRLRDPGGGALTLDLGSTTLTRAL